MMAAWDLDKDGVRTECWILGKVHQVTDTGDIEITYYQQDQFGKYFRYNGNNMIVRPEDVICEVCVTAQTISSGVSFPTRSG